jgi:RIO kinase 2
MSSADMAVRVFRELENEDFRILQIIESAMTKREYVPTEQIKKYGKVPLERVEFSLGKLNKLGLIYQTRGAYTGHTLNYAGYDCLAINAWLANVIASFGQTCGRWQADVYDALSQRVNVCSQVPPVRQN